MRAPLLLLYFVPPSPQEHPSLLAGVAPPWPRRRARVPARTRPESANKRLIHHLRPLNHLLDKPSTTQNPGDLGLTGDLAPLLYGDQNGEDDGGPAAVVDGKG